MNPTDPHNLQTPAADENEGHERSAQEYTGDEVQAGLVAIVGVFAAVVLLLIIVLVQAWYYSWKGQVAARQAIPADASATPVGRMLVEQQRQLDEYRWVDREKRIYAIPIDRAMNLVVEQSDAGRQPDGKRREGDHEKTK